MNVICAVLAAALLASAAPAQEFGRASAGQIEMVTKGADRVSGTLELSRSGIGTGYGMTLGGTLLRDRVWFFASASLMPELSESRAMESLDAKMTAQLGDRQTLSALFSDVKAGAGLPQMPSSFLSLRYDATASNSLFFSATIRRTTTTQWLDATP